MQLTPGTRLGVYEIVGLLGAGGMGEVYRATDTNLKRAVAIKVLPEAFATDAERLARFQREAEVLASLNHPNIAAIHGLERANTTTALVMELVEGPTVAERIARGPVPLDEALPIAKQIAEALEAAHEQGIIHRDLKPANIKLRPDGKVKVLDFGLAKAFTQDPLSSPSGLTNSPTITSPVGLTGVGVLLGTAAYMSPEQAKGQSVDKRSDVWAFGAVLYEMLTARRAFEGDDVSDTLARILMNEPDWAALPTTVPATCKTSEALCRFSCVQLGRTNPRPASRARSHHPPSIRSMRSSRQTAAGSPTARTNRGPRRCMCRPSRVLVKRTAFPQPEAATRRGRATAANCSISETEVGYSGRKCRVPVN